MSKKLFVFDNAVKAFLPKKGSILAYSLVIIAAMLVIASSISVVAVIEKKAASGTEFSIQSLQTADSGVQQALKKINIELKNPTGPPSGGSPKSIAKIKAIFPACDSGTNNVPNNTDGGPANSSYELSFYDKDGNKLICATADVSQIASIKSVGTFNNTVRAVNVAVAANISSFKTFHHDGSSFATESGLSCSPNCKIADLCNKQFAGSSCVTVAVKNASGFVGMEDCATAYGVGNFASYTGFDFVCGK